MWKSSLRPTLPSTSVLECGIPHNSAGRLEGGRIRMKLHVGGEFELVSWI